MTSKESRFNPVPSRFITRFEEILQQLQGTYLESKTDGTTLIDKSRSELERISREMSNPPKLTVAVYGDTGSGKSSMLNALLDQPSLVPTAGMGRACTSVAIKIEENTINTNFEADIEFLTKEEWEKEISVITKDLKAEQDNSEDDDDVYESARAMVKAVYGEYDDDNLLEVIQSQPDILTNLGSVLPLSDTNTRSLQDNICQYIETSEGIQYWPIVKQVTLKVPCSVLYGCELIDLPGVGDSNPARDNVAKKYMNTCDVLLIVTKIQRAIDNKTARTVLGDTLFRQVKLDHRKAALVCTQTDDVKPAEVIRKLKLPQAKKWTEENKNYTEEEKQLAQTLTTIRREIEEGEMRVAGTLHERETETYRKLELVRGKITQHRREKRSTCAVERNKFVKRTILNKTSSDGESIKDMDVFCVSSADYIKLNNLLTCDEDDDKPAVFISGYQTEIPDLRNFLQRTAKEKQDRKANSLWKDFKVVISGLMTYLSNTELGGKEVLEKALKTNLERMSIQVQNTVTDVDHFIEDLFCTSLYPVLQEAAAAAEEQASQKSYNWTRPVNTRQREKGGLAFRTYKATVQRHGQFVSQGIKYKISMNEDLSDPFVRIITPKWHEMFSEKTWDDILRKRIRDPVTDIITNCCNEIVTSVKSIGSDVTALSDGLTQLKTDTVDKLARLDMVWILVQQQQREITHNIPARVQATMKNTYELCQEKGGQGAFQDMKTIMALRVDQLKATMFRDIMTNVIKLLESLKDQVIVDVKHILDDICEDHRKQIEPLWQTHGGQQFFHNVRECKQLLHQLYSEVKDYEQTLTENTGDLNLGKRKTEATNSDKPDTAKAPRQM